jgi:hypothetical protein
MLSIFPEEPGADWLRSVPWWNALHFLVQATTILLIKVSLESSSQKQKGPMSTGQSSNDQSLDRSTVLDSAALRAAANKGLLWLCHLGKNDDSARRAFELCNSCVHRIEPRCFVAEDTEGVSNALTASHLEVPTDQKHQQHRSRFDVSYSQFAGMRGFGYDHNLSGATIPLGLEDTEDIGFFEPSVGTLGVDIDMSDYIPDLQNVNLDEVLQSLA